MLDIASMGEAESPIATTFSECWRSNVSRCVSACKLLYLDRPASPTSLARAEQYSWHRNFELIDETIVIHVQNRAG